MNPMRRAGPLVLLSLVGAALLTGLVRLPTSRPAIGGTLVVAPDVVECDIGDGQGSSRQVTLRVTNRSPVVQLVDSVKASCGCTMAKPLETTRLEPGASIPLNVTLRLPDYGHRTTFLRVQYGGQSPSTAVVRFELQGQRPPVPSFKGGPLRQFTIPVPRDKLENVVRVVRVTTLEERGAPPWIIGVESSAPSLWCDLKGMSEARDAEGGDIVSRTYEVALQYHARSEEDVGKPLGLRLLTASASGREAHDVAIALDIVDPVRLVPARLSLRRSGAPVDTYQVALLSDRSTVFRVVPEGEIPGVDVELSPPRPQGHRTLSLISVRLRPEETPDRDGPAVIQFRAVDPPFETARLPVDFLD